MLGKHSLLWDTKAMTPTTESLQAREMLAAHRDELDALLVRYGASNPRLFGSVARGDAGPQSDIDILVDLEDPHRRTLMRIAGLTEGLRRVLGRPVDVLAPVVLRDAVSREALAEAVAL
ncbi:hypothetical protein SAMN04487766_110107 [Actinomyces ruminicola]|uniref:Polymerase nucleotidyl transferase domain-containing protein n=2 Tax=Actinomyces ruminicola TaxID=332524 RepID=A0A1G9XWP6_9ACTO|nr:hypothetical protein SAMN04487766_110107 [Actinomyces ruminicola]